MKLGIVGKGGTGKTTTSSLLAQEFAARGRRVLAVDTDSNPNLAMSLGLDPSTSDLAPVLPRSLVVGTGDGRTSPSDLIRQYGLTTPMGVTVLHAMRVTDAGAGCTCSSHASVRSLLAAAIEDEADVTLVDMEAGLEHLSRAGGTLAHADVLLIVMEPTRKAILTGARTIALANDLGISQVYGLGNKARLPGDAEFFSAVAAEYGVPLAGIVPHDPEVAQADRAGAMVAPGQGESARRAVAGIVDFLDASLDRRAALLSERDRIDRRLAELLSE